MTSVTQRKKTERKIATMFLKSVLAAGMNVTIDNGESCPVKKSTNRGEILANMFSTDEERLYVLNSEGKIIGWCFFVYGNSGWDVICDYSPSLEPYMSEIHEYTSQF